MTINKALNEGGKLYKVEFDIVHRALDIFNDGCQPGTAISHWVEPIVCTSGTLDGLLDTVREYFNVDKDSLLLNSCDEVGRLDVQTYTTGAYGIQCVFKKHKGAFESGARNLWLNDFSGVVTVTHAVDLQPGGRHEK